MRVFEGVVEEGVRSPGHQVRVEGGCPEGLEEGVGQLAQDAAEENEGLEADATEGGGSCGAGWFLERGGGAACAPLKVLRRGLIAWVSGCGARVRGCTGGLRKVVCDS
jgi:hypothetical protein